VKTTAKTIAMNGMELNDDLAKNSLDNVKNPQDIIILDLSNNDLTKIPSAIKKFKNLKFLHIDGNLLTSLDASLLPEGLTYLSVSCNKITSVTNLSTLKQLGIFLASYNNIEKLENLPSSLNVLTLEKNLLSSVELKDLNLKIVNLSQNNFESFPKEISRMQQLKILMFSGNKHAVELPNKIDSFEGLRHLFIRQLPNRKAIIEAISSKYLPSLSSIHYQDISRSTDDEIYLLHSLSEGINRYTPEMTDIEFNLLKSIKKNKSPMPDNGVTKGEMLGLTSHLDNNEPNRIITFYGDCTKYQAKNGNSSNNSKIITVTIPV